MGHRLRHVTSVLRHAVESDMRLTRARRIGERGGDAIVFRQLVGSDVDLGLRRAVRRVEKVVVERRAADCLAVPGSHAVKIDRERDNFGLHRRRRGRPVGLHLRVDRRPATSGTAFLT